MILSENDFLTVSQCVAHRASAHYTNHSVRWKVDIPNTGKHIMFFAILSMDGTKTYEWITYKNVWSVLDGCKSVYIENVIEHLVPPKIV